MRTALAGAVAALALCGGCGDPGDGTSIRLVVPDENIREEGVECAGARPFQHVHAGAPFTIEADDGSVVAEGTLPAGHAENAEPEIDWEVERIPTFCVVELEVELPERPRYRLVLDGERPLDFTVDAEPVQLVLS